MKAQITHNEQTFSVDLSKPLDISIPLSTKENPVAWYLDQPHFEPVTDEEWIGLVSKGGDVNFRTITFNPHSHGTHTESVGHITEEIYSVNKHLKQFFFTACLVTVIPERQGDDDVITEALFKTFFEGSIPEALVIRTLPNMQEKQHMKWSHTNWPYIDEGLMVRFRESGIKHLLIDLPSVDKEKDDGKLLAHHAFWNTAGSLRLDATITEMIYVPHEIPDGRYLLNLQIAPFDNDATPSKPILYALD